ncbi:MAG: Ig domain-containing protein [Clostridia bacterium]|nr:Ig domain-containing protein [Clostridia bacterium]
MKRKIGAVLLVLCMLLGIVSPALAASVKAKKISLNKTSVTLTLGTCYQLKATITPTNTTNKGVTWKSSNSSVASVSSSGMVTTKKAGTTTITATSKSNSKLKATCKITVTSPKVSSVSLNQTRLELVGGKSYTLKAKVSPATANQSVTWKSSNTKVATVSSKGVVTPKGYGTAIISAISKEGNKIATCKITVPKTKIYSKSYTVASEWPYYMKDNISVVVDGLTGKIVESDVYQSKRDTGFLCLISKDGTKVLYQCADYITVRTTWTVKLGLFWKFTTDAVTVTSVYTMYKDGRLVRDSYVRR